MNMKRTLLVIMVLALVMTISESHPMKDSEEIEDSIDDLEKRSAKKFNKADYNSVAEGNRRWIG